VSSWRFAEKTKENAMSNHVYKMLELTGSSPISIEEAVQTAISKASETVRNIQWFSITETRGHVIEGKVAHWQVTIKLGFTLE
jgi:flavin-binding protein dodecin